MALSPISSFSFFSRIECISRSIRFSAFLDFTSIFQFHFPLNLR